MDAQADRNDQKIKIPRVIMQMWDDHNIPFRWITSPASVRKYVSEWRYVLLTKEIYRDFVLEYFPDYIFYYDSFTHDIQKANALCYMWMYKVGGVYMSLNYELLKKLDSLFYHGNGDAYFVPSTNNSKWFTNSFIAAKPGCGIFLECLEAMKLLTPWWCLDKQSTILYTTGAGMLSRTLKKTKAPFNTINSRDIPSCSICETRCGGPGAYVTKLADEIWDEWDTYFYNVMYCNWKWIVVLSITIIVILWFYAKLGEYPNRKIYTKRKNKNKITKATNDNDEGRKIKTEIL